MEKQLADGIVSLKTDYDIVDAQRAAALSDVSLLKEETFARLQTENNTLSRENERLANIEHHPDTTLTEITSLKEDATRFKTENALILEDVLQLRQARSEVSVLKEEITQLKTENDNILKEKQEQILNESRMVKAQLAAALSDMSQLREEIARLQAEKDILSRENERLANIEHHPDTTPTEITSPNEDATRFKTENALLLEDVLQLRQALSEVTVTFTEMTRFKTENTLLLEDVSQLRQARSEVSVLKEEITQLKTENDNILKEKQEQILNESRMVKAQLVAALSDMAQLREEIARLQAEKDILSRENERLANIEHHPDTTLTEITSLNEDATRFKTENA